MLSTSLVKPLLPSTLRPPLARALLTSFQLQAHNGSYRINSLVYIYPDTFQLCHKLNTFCSPECNTINGNLSGIKQGNWNIRVVFGPLKRSYWRLPKGSKPGNREQPERHQRRRGKGPLSEVDHKHHHTLGPGQLHPVLQWHSLFRSAGKSGK